MARIRDGFGWTLALTVALLIVAAGLCLVDQGHEPMSDHGMSPDLCAGLLVVALAVPLLAGPGLAGWYRPALVRSSGRIRGRALDPPPRSRSLR